MLDPARFREDLGKLLLGCCLDLSLAVEYYCPRTAGSLVKGKDIFLHDMLWLVYSLADKGGGCHRLHLYVAVVSCLLSSRWEYAHLVAACSSAQLIRILL